MSKLFGFIGATIGSYAGWYVGSQINMVMAFIVMIIGTAAGGYYARKMAKNYET
jgi:hypothetical protein